MIPIVLLSGIIANCVFSLIIRASECCAGGSVIVFPVIGMLAVLKLLKKDTTPFRLGTWYGNWTVGYAVIGNIFNGSFQIGDWTTILLHGVAFLAGAVLTLICLPFLVSQK